jgi:uncharacterized membrane protein
MKGGLLTLELRISNLLRFGVLLAGAFLFVGWMTLLDFTQNPLADFKDYKEQTLMQSLEQALQNNQWGLLIAYVGLAILISLPLLRVLLTGFLFIKQKEKTLAAIAFFVFLILILSFSLGIEL